MHSDFILPFLFSHLSEDGENRPREAHVLKPSHIFLGSFIRVHLHTGRVILFSLPTLVKNCKPDVERDLRDDGFLTFLFYKWVSWSLEKKEEYLIKVTETVWVTAQIFALLLPHPRWHNCKLPVETQRPGRNFTGRNQGKCSQGHRVLTVWFLRLEPILPWKQSAGSWTPFPEISASYPTALPDPRYIGRYFLFSWCAWAFSTIFRRVLKPPALPYLE